MAAIIEFDSGRPSGVTQIMGLGADPLSAASESLASATRKVGVVAAGVLVIGVVAGRPAYTNAALGIGVGALLVRYLTRV